MSNEMQEEDFTQCEGCRCDGKTGKAEYFTDDDVGFCTPCWVGFLSGTLNEKDAEQADMKHDIERLYQTNTDLVNEIEGYRKTVRTLAAALKTIVKHFGPCQKEFLFSKRQAIQGARNTLSENAPRIAEAKESKI